MTEYEKAAKATNSLIELAEYHIGRGECFVADVIDEYLETADDPSKAMLYDIVTRA